MIAIAAPCFSSCVTTTLYSLQITNFFYEFQKFQKPTF